MLSVFVWGAISPHSARHAHAPTRCTTIDAAQDSKSCLKRRCSGEKDVKASLLSSSVIAANVSCGGRKASLRSCLRFFLQSHCGQLATYAG